MTSLGTRVGGKKKQTQKRKGGKKHKGGFLNKLLNKSIGGDEAVPAPAPAPAPAPVPVPEPVPVPVPVPAPAPESSPETKPAVTEEKPAAVPTPTTVKPWWKFWAGKRNNKTAKKRNNKKHK